MIYGRYFTMVRYSEAILKKFPQVFKGLAKILDKFCQNINDIASITGIKLIRLSLQIASRGTLRFLRGDDARSEG
ncbi:hypothetical protein BV900_10820 [Agrobacterium tumefaciens]|nr:hypothetical protein BV900_10820 [Agrobacterium tumefaciens]